jgi:hypothetical protein
MKQSDVDREIEHMIANRKHYSNTNNPIDFPKSKNKMNERIYLLAEQAGAYCEVLRGGDYKPPVLDGMNLEKFAELIIRDCMDVVDGYTKGRTFDTHYDAVVQIETLFGIKHNRDDE